MEQRGLEEAERARESEEHEKKSKRDEFLSVPGMFVIIGRYGLFKQLADFSPVFMSRKRARGARSVRVRPLVCHRGDGTGQVFGSVTEGAKTFLDDNL